TDTPYIDETMDYTSGADDLKKDVDLWLKIEAAFLYAYENPPNTQGQVARLNKWAAASHLAKVYMYQHKFSEANALFDAIIPAAYGGTGEGHTSNGNPYGLVPRYADIFKASNDNHEEAVWAYQAAA